MFVFTKAHIDAIDPAYEWRTFRKVTPTRMMRVGGPFTVETREGWVSCEDGWLAVDSQGFPYPVAADEHDAIYEEIT